MCTQGLPLRRIESIHSHLDRRSRGQVCQQRKHRARDVLSYRWGVDGQHGERGGDPFSTFDNTVVLVAVDPDRCHRWRRSPMHLMMARYAVVAECSSRM